MIYEQDSFRTNRLRRYRHIRYFYSIPHFEEIELVGIYDMNKPFLQKTAEELGVKAFNSYEEMLDDPTIDAVIVTTYHPSHTPLAIQP